MDRPAIKGSVMANLVEDVLRLRDEGRMSQRELEAALELEDLEIVKGKVLASAWYPIASYQRLTELVQAEEGGDEDYLRARGAASLERLMASGLYEEMRRLALAEPNPSFERVENAIRNLVVLSQNILNFGRSEVVRDPDHEKRLLIQIYDAADYPEVLRFTSEGFYSACARAAGGSFRWHSSRPSPDRIVMRMDADFDA